MSMTREQCIERVGNAVGAGRYYCVAQEYERHTDGEVIDRMHVYIDRQIGFAGERGFIMQYGPTWEAVCLLALEKYNIGEWEGTGLDMEDKA